MLRGFGNFQAAGDVSRHRETANEAGRFCCRRPTGESSADVCDRAGAFWGSLPGRSFDECDPHRRRAGRRASRRHARADDAPPGDALLRLVAPDVRRGVQPRQLRLLGTGEGR